MTKLVLFVWVELVNFKLTNLAKYDDIKTNRKEGGEWIGKEYNADTPVYQLSKRM